MTVVLYCVVVHVGWFWLVRLQLVLLVAIAEDVVLVYWFSLCCLHDMRVVCGSYACFVG